MRRLLIPILLLALAAPAHGEVSYRSLTRPKDEAAFYKCGGRSHRGKRVHLHVPAGRLRGKPKRIVHGARGGRLLLFENRSVPLVVSPGNVYFRKILQRTGPGDRICVKGTVQTEPLGGKGRHAIFIHTLKTAP